MILPFARPAFSRALILSVTLLLAFGTVSPAAAQLSPFTQSLAESAASDQVIATFYRDRGYKTLWTSAEDAARRNALLTVLSRAADHGLPVQRYDAKALTQAFQAARTEADRGKLEVRMTRAFLDYARDIQTGILVPAKVDPGIVREVPLRDPAANLAAFEAASPLTFLHNLPPKSPAYAQLMKARLQLDARITSGGWGAQIPAGALKPGDTGPMVVAMRDRLIAMDFLKPTASGLYDNALQKAVQSFQLYHGLQADGIAGEGTIAEININPEARLKSVLVAMERERWLNIDRKHRYIWVNLADFTAKIIDNGKITFATRSVVGKNVPDQRTPEFSDVMELMVINPSWSVPRSITTKEYLPLLKRNPNAAGHLRIVDRNGRIVSRGSINFNQYTASNFPFSMSQPPSDGNALGLVKFLFPNPYNIYLHDTPSKSLFASEVRAFSHGCIRLSNPFDFAYALLGPQSDDPVAEFKSHLKTGAESPIRLETPVPVHLVYFTAYPSTKGQIAYRRDIYGRDALIFDALTEAGVALRAVQG
ncbi:MAG: L,D-transpeptidase family protein [Paracoccaceae bacterium]